MISSYYIIFAVTTAIVATLLLLNPVLRDLGDLRPIHNMVEYPWLTRATFFCIFLLIAPTVLLPTVISSLGSTFKQGMLKELLKDS